MSEEDLEVLITLDDPEGAPEEDTFDHLHPEKASERHKQPEDESGEITMSCCSHLSEINNNVTPKTPNGCEECLKMGDRWLHLRLCVTCGHVGCCEDSKNKHATKHFHSTNHPIIKSFEPDEDWGWCYVDELFFESFPGSLTQEWCGALGATP